MNDVVFLFFNVDQLYSAFKPTLMQKIALLFSCILIRVDLIIAEWSKNKIVGGSPNSNQKRLVNNAPIPCQVTYFDHVAEREDKISL